MLCQLQLEMSELVHYQLGDECLWRAYRGIYFQNNSLLVQQISEVCASDGLSLWKVICENDSSPKNREWPSLLSFASMSFLEEGNLHASTTFSRLWSLHRTDRPKIHPWLSYDKKILFVNFWLERSRRVSFWKGVSKRVTQHVDTLNMNHFLHTTITETSFNHDLFDGCSSVFQN